MFLYQFRLLIECWWLVEVSEKIKKSKIDWDPRWLPFGNHEVILLCDVISSITNRKGPRRPKTAQSEKHIVNQILCLILQQFMETTHASEVKMPVEWQSACFEPAQYTCDTFHAKGDLRASSLACSFWSTIPSGKGGCLLIVR